MYYPDQTVCTNINEFIKCYNRIYFYDANTSVVTEMLADNLLKKNKLEKLDVFNILAWKVDGIDTNATIDLDKIRYKRKWKAENGKFFGDNIYHQLKMDKVIEYISDNSERWLAHWDKKEIGYDPEYAQEVISKIINITNEETGTYIGEVYIITLLYFVTKGRWPIYDQFASIAMNAMIDKGMIPYNKVDDIKLPGKNDIAFAKRITTEGKYIEYVDFIREIQAQSDYKYFSSRDIDRALWTYGHIIKKWSKIKENSKK